MHIIRKTMANRVGGCRCNLDNLTTKHQSQHIVSCVEALFTNENKGRTAKRMFTLPHLRTSIYNKTNDHSAMKSSCGGKLLAYLVLKSQPSTQRMLEYLTFDIR